MTLRRSLSGMALLAGFVFLAFTSAATAQDVANKLTYFTFSHAVELPGNITLPAGRYQFRLADATTSKRVVQVLDEKGKVYALLLTRQAVRSEPSQETQVRFMEVAENQPPAVKLWWYTAESFGYEFVYPKEQALRLTKATGTAIPMTESPMGTAKELEAAAVTVAEPAPSGTIASTPILETVVASNEAATLPRTASPLMLIGLIGALSLAGAGGIRLFR